METKKSAETKEPLVPPPVIFGACLAIGLAIDYLYPAPMLSGYVQYLVGAVFIGAGAGLAALFLLSLKKADTDIHPAGSPTSLVTSGPYQYSRNPGYVGLTLLYIGIAIFIDSIAVLVLVIPAVWITNQFVVKREEAKLARIFGEDYRAYMERVRRWL